MYLGKRYALIQGLRCEPTVVRSYLPSNYRVLWSGLFGATGRLPPEPTIVVEGRDSSGYTLDGFVLPRLGSGGYGAREIDLTHPVMLLIPEDFR